MESEAILLLTNVFMRSLVLFLPHSLGSFAFNEGSLTEAREALNAHGSRILLCGWTRRNVGVVVSSSAKRASCSVSLITFAGIEADGIALSIIVWRFVRVDRLRSRPSAWVVTIALCATDVLFFFAFQERLISFLEP